jgi:hypothetical protein
MSFVSTPISGIVNRTGVDLVSVAGETLAAAVARGRGAWLDGGGDSVVVLVGADPLVVLVATDAVVAPVPPEQAETMVVARRATTAIVRSGRCPRSRGNDARSA